MKRLANSTIIKKLKTIGFTLNKNTGNLVRCKGSVSQYMFLEFRGNIKISDVRWSKRGNVHIVSYWQHPSTLKDLDKLINDMKETYSELCGINWD